LNLEHCSKSQKLDTGYVYIYKKAGSVSGLPPFVGGNLLACSVAITTRCQERERVEPEFGPSGKDQKVKDREGQDEDVSEGKKERMLAGFL